GVLAAVDDKLIEDVVRAVDGDAVVARVLDLEALQHPVVAAHLDAARAEVLGRKVQHRPRAARHPFDADGRRGGAALCQLLGRRERVRPGQEPDRRARAGATMRRGQRLERSGLRPGVGVVAVRTDEEIVARRAGAGGAGGPRAGSAGGPRAGGAAAAGSTGRAARTRGARTGGAAAPARARGAAAGAAGARAAAASG